jgi:hypothetical protein
MQGSWEFQSPSSGSWVPFTAPNNKRISQAAESGARVNRLFVSPLFSHLPLALWPYSRELSYYCDILRVNMPSSECAQRDETLNQCSWPGEPTVHLSDRIVVDLRTLTLINESSGRVCNVRRIGSGMVVQARRRRLAGLLWSYFGCCSNKLLSSTTFWWCRQDYAAHGLRYLRISTAGADASSMTPI